MSSNTVLSPCKEVNVWQEGCSDVVGSQVCDPQNGEQRFVATQGQTLFILTAFSYAPGTNSLAIHIEGLLVDPLNVIEISPTAFILQNETVQQGDIVVANALTGLVAAVEVVITALSTSKITLIDGQLEVPFPAAASVGNSSVYINGFGVDTGRLIEDIDYTIDIPSNTVTLIDSYPAGTILILVHNDALNNPRALPDNTAWHEFTTELGASQHPLFTVGGTIITNNFNDTYTPDSGANFEFTGVTDLPKAGLAPDLTTGFFYDADGKQFGVTGIPNVKQFGAVGEDTPDRDAINAASVFADTVGGVVEFPASSETYIIDSALTISAGVIFRIPLGAVISIADGVTLTMSTSIEAGPYHCITYVGTGNIRYLVAATLNLGWWPAYLTAAHVGWNAGFAAIKNIGGKLLIPLARAIATQAINFTDSDVQTIVIEGEGQASIITFEHTGIGIDCTGSNRLVFKSFEFSGNIVTTPTVGIFFARQATSGNSLFSRMYDVFSNGNFTKAAHYAYASEECRYFRCYFLNGADNSACYWNTGDNLGVGEGVVSTFTTTAVGENSNSDNMFYGCTFLMFGGGDSDCMRLRKTINTHFFGFFVAAVNASAPRSIVYFDLTPSENNVAYCTFTGFRHESGTLCRYGFYMAGEGTLANVSITNGTLAGTIHQFFAAGDNTVNGLVWENNSNLIGGTTAVDLYNLSFSTVTERSQFNIRNDVSGSELSIRSIFATINNNVSSRIFFSDLGTDVPVITPAFNAGDFTANGSMTWDVEAGDADTYAYSINGKLMTLMFQLNATSVGGTLDTTLRIAIPESKTVAKTVRSLFKANDGGAPGEVGVMDATLNNGFISLRLLDDSNWGAATDTTVIAGEFVFEIN